MKYRQRLLRQPRAPGSVGKMRSYIPAKYAVVGWRLELVGYDGWWDVVSVGAESDCREGPEQLVRLHRMNTGDSMKGRGDNA